MYRYEKRYVVASVMVGFARVRMGVVLQFEETTKLVVVFLFPYLSVGLHLAGIYRELKEQKVKVIKAKLVCFPCFISS